VFLIRTEGNHLLLYHRKKTRKPYSEDVMKIGRLKSAKSLDVGWPLYLEQGKLKYCPINESKEVTVGCFLILAKNINEDD
jgi:hypothetical protein